MGTTIILSLVGCALLFLGIWGVTVTLPTKLLAKNFPQDVQERLQPRLEELERRGFSFLRFFVRFLIIGGVIKAFDIGALDYFLLTKTHFFQRYFPETEGCAGWQDFGYNRKQQARQIVMILVGSALTAWIFTWIG